VVPGSKATMADLGWLRESGFAAAIARRAQTGGLVLGVCGGCQMLGRTIDDPDRVEGDVARVEGLGLLPIATRFARDKRTTQVRARAAASSFLAPDSAVEIAGYEIHMGRVRRDPAGPGAFAIHARNGAPEDDHDGAVSPEGSVVGTMIHGLFDNAPVRAALLGYLRARKGVPAPAPPASPTAGDEYDRLAAVLRANVDTSLLDRLLTP
jgi:adenosylcobyric acid synthase